MDTNFYQNWHVRKPIARGSNGVVASHHKAAAEVGAAVLREGGNAIDAAVATSFAVSVVEQSSFVFINHGPNLQWNPGMRPAPASG